MIFLFDDKTEPADIFADIPSEKPGAPPPPSSAVPTARLPATAASAVMVEHAGFGKKGLALLLIILLIIGGGAAVFFTLRKPSAEPTTSNQKLPDPEPQPEPQPQPQVEVDSDGDGLSDTREAQLGTNSGTVDSDSDGLSDREEAEVYATDPLNPDSDADTYKDGDEVKNGYNPKGPGKLLQLPPAS